MDLSDYKTFGLSFWTAVVQLTPKKMETIELGTK